MQPAMMRRGALADRVNQTARRSPPHERTSPSGGGARLGRHPVQHGAHVSSLYGTRSKMKNGASPFPVCSGTATYGRRQNIIISSAAPAVPDGLWRARRRSARRLPIATRASSPSAIEGDGDLMYAPGSLWTAAHHKIPLLMIVHNNRAYHQEVMHLQRMAGLA